MGISGHILSEKNLRKLARNTGLDLDRAYRMNHYAEGRVVTDGECLHYEINPRTFEHGLIEDPVHWSTCPASGRKPVVLVPSIPLASEAGWSVPDPVTYEEVDRPDMPAEFAVRRPIER